MEAAIFRLLEMLRFLAWLQNSHVVVFVEENPLLLALGLAHSTLVHRSLDLSQSSEVGRQPLVLVREPQLILIVLPCESLHA